MGNHSSVSFQNDFWIGNEPFPMNILSFQLENLLSKTFGIPCSKMGPRLLKYFFGCVVQDVPLSQIRSPISVSSVQMDTPTYNNLLLKDIVSKSV